MMNFRMKKSFLALAATACCCLSCIEINYGIGSDLMPQNQIYTIHTITIPIEDISMEMADSLSGYSSKRITVGAVRDDTFGLTTRACALTLIPMFQDTLDLGRNPRFQSFHFSAAKDTVSFARPDQERIFQTLRVYELAEPLDASVNFDCNLPVDHLDGSITRSSVVYTGDDSLSFNFTTEFGQKYLDALYGGAAADDLDSYLEKCPGIYIEADEPSGDGGRINLFELQLGYDLDNYMITGNYARMRFSSEFDGERKDTTLLFYYGAQDFYDIDSLLTNSSTGSYPQYSLNLTSQETRALEGRATDKIYVEGGGGLKPKISGKTLKQMAENAIIEAGGNPATAVINKASIVLPFEFPADYTDMDRWPQILSPTCRIIYDDEGEEQGGASFVSLTDSSDESANQGDVNRSTLRYAPDITYHMQSLMKIDEDDKSSEQTKMLDEGSYDVWFLIMANEVTVTTEAGSDELSELYNYLAYQSYYNDMYGYGYGSGYSNYYSNYYTYAMMASMYGSSNTTESITVQLDKDRYYNAVLNGPESAEGEVPTLELTFSIPVEEPEE